MQWVQKCRFCKLYSRSFIIYVVSLRTCSDIRYVSYFYLLFLHLSVLMWCINWEKKDIIAQCMSRWIQVKRKQNIAIESTSSNQSQSFIMFMRLYFIHTIQFSYCFSHIFPLLILLGCVSCFFTFFFFLSCEAITYEYICVCHFVGIQYTVCTSHYTINIYRGIEFAPNTTRFLLQD